MVGVERRAVAEGRSRAGTVAGRKPVATEVEAVSAAAMVALTVVGGLQRLTYLGTGAILTERASARRRSPALTWRPC